MERVGLILPPQSGAASDSICFKYMDRRVWAVARTATARDDTRREREKGGRGEVYTILGVSYAKTGPHFYRDSLSEQGRSTGMRKEREKERGGTTPLYDTTRFPRYSLVSEANTPHPPDSWIQSNESPLPPPRPNLFSNLPAARYRLPNKLTECSALRLPPVSLSWFPSRIGSISVQTEPPPPSLNRDILRDPALFRPNYAHDYLPGGRPRSKSGEEEDFGKGTLLESDRISTRIDSRFNFLLSLFLRGTLDYLATTYDGTCDNVQRGPDLTQSEIPSDHLPRLPDRGLPASPPPRYI